jgi:hypothetical protein
MRTKHVGRHWEVVGRDPRVKGEHRSYARARKQEGAIHLHIRQAKGGGTLLTIFGPTKKQSKNVRSGLAGAFGGKSKSKSKSKRKSKRK